MLLPRFEDAANDTATKDYTPVLRVIQKPPPLKKKCIVKQPNRCSPRKLSKDKWLYVEELEVVIGRISFQSKNKLMLDNGQVLTVNRNVIRHGWYDKRSLCNMHFELREW
jgi:hypothetical protein